MGIIVNVPHGRISLHHILAQYDGNSKKNSEVPHAILEKPLYFGGPVEPSRGFILHSNDYTENETLKITQTISLTISHTIIKDIVAQRGPMHYLIALGYAGWSFDQLEHEIYHNIWHILPADDDILFSPHDKYLLVLEKLHLQPWNNSNVIGKG